MLVWSFVVLFVGFISWWKLRSRKHIQNVTERHVFITGCDTGFGRLLAKRLDEMGVFVYAGCYSKNSVEELQESCSTRLKAIQLDITDTEDIIRAANFVENDLAEKSKNAALWAIVNNAGIAIPAYPFEWHNKQDYQKVFEVNLFGTVDVTLKFVPLLKRGREGRIVNLSSISGRIAALGIPYMASKFAVEGFADGLTFELRPFNITTHVIEPSFFKTNLTNINQQIAGIKKRFEEQNDEMKQSYGESYLVTKIKGVKTMLSDMASPNLQQVVDAIVHALFAVHPKERYAVGADAKFLLLPLSFLPTGYQEWIMRKLRRLIKAPNPHPEQAVLPA